jgi:environmental stress-induced protein Ves
VSERGVEHLPAAARSQTPWKNGGGVTSEIAAYPAGAGLDDFGWRVSTATVAAGGPFSRFDEIDRTLLVLGGEGLRLQIGERPPATVTPESGPISFPGDIAVHAELLDGPVSDLNVMTRRGEWRSQLQRLIAEAPRATFRSADVSLVIALGPLVARNAGETVALAPGDAIRLAAREILTVEPVAPGAEVVVVDLWRST